jgi:hypothetical protein
MQGPSTYSKETLTVLVHVVDDGRSSFPEGGPLRGQHQLGVEPRADPGGVQGVCHVTGGRTHNRC